MSMPEAVHRDRQAREDEHRRDGDKPTADRVPVTRRSHRLRRGLATLAIAVALPAAIATPQAAACQVGCTYESKEYSEGSVVKMPDGIYVCQSGIWVKKP